MTRALSAVVFGRPDAERKRRAAPADDAGAWMQRRQI
jgi:hypothetical protein